MLALALATPPALAYMAVLRQGSDSAGLIEPGDRHGAALATGDFNGDGFDDLATGAPLEDLVFAGEDRTDTGAIVVSYGSPYGLTHVDAEYRYGCNSESFCETGMQFGYALAAGDFNDDGWDDLIVGAPLQDVGGAPDAGHMYIMLGSPTGLLTGFPNSEQSAAEVPEPGDRFGSSFAVGDFNGDGVDDLAVGAPGENGSGAVFFFIADPKGASGLWGTTGWFLQTDLGGTNDVNDEFGYSLAAGNFYGSAHDDLVAGAPFRTVGFTDFAGEIYLVQGGLTGLSNSNAESYTAGSAGGTQTNGRFGYSLAAGRFRSAGVYECVAIGEPGRTVSEEDEGRVVVVRGGADNLDFVDFEQLDERLQLATAFDHFGQTLAAGAWNPAVDAWDDLAVGAPYRDITGSVDPGQVFLFYGSSAGLSVANSDGWDQGFVSDPNDAGDQCGYSLAFGNFDGYGRGNLAIGVPGQDEDDDSLEETPQTVDAGYVLVLAPWRQVINPGGRNALMVTPGDSIIYALRPFDRVRPASTTKVMTAVLGLEGNLGFDYEVPSWIEDDVGGSTPFALEEDEIISLVTLLFPMIMVSDNGAAYAIADVVSYGGTAAPLAVCNFVDAMNARAGVLGMAGTNFSNPPGRDNPSNDCDDHYSTPEAMVKLAQAAVADPSFRAVSSIETFPIARNVVRDAEYVIELDTLFNSCVEGLRDLVPGTVLAKTGTTGGAGKCLLFAASDGGTGYAVGSLFAMPMEYNGRCGQTTADLINLGLTRAGPEPFDALLKSAEHEVRPAAATGPAASCAVTPGDLVYMALRGLSTTTDSLYGGSTELETSSDTTFVTLCLEPGSGSTALELGVMRGSLAILDPGDFARYRLNPAARHRGFRISNAGDVSATIQVSMTHPNFSASYFLLPRDHAVLPAFTGIGTGVFQLTISNVGGNRPALEVEELGYDITLTLSPPGFTTFNAMLMDSPKVYPFGMHVTTAGLDANPGNRVIVSVHGRADAVVGVPDPAPRGPEQNLLRALPSHPNPFRTQTALRYALAREGRLTASIFDVAGRLVRRLDWGHTPGGVGFHLWDGSDHHGLPVSHGVFLVRFALDGIATDETRVVRIE
ncbi:MAG TPA: FG-GAP-like repeat-containing protein [Candidatus Limnocylindria bacterium]|nr:FG-GAP-like repeat-containing protein [Candidatus Limnocylindria bacterium]